MNKQQAIVEKLSYAMRVKTYDATTTNLKVKSVHTVTNNLLSKDE